MVSEHLQIVITDDDSLLIRGLSDALGRSKARYFRAECTDDDTERNETGYDATYLTLPGAERWNVRPVLDTLQMIHTSDADRAAGWPPYLIVGLALSPKNAVSPEAGLRTWAKALFDLLDRSDKTVKRIEVPANLVSLDRIAPVLAASILCDAARRVH